jgi:hypothetical protein
MSKTKSLASKLDEDLFEDFHKSVTHYYIGTGASFVEMACRALVSAYRRGDNLPMPLRFISTPGEEPKPEVNAKRKNSR